MNDNLSGISIKDENAFVELKTDFDEILKTTMICMREKGSATSDITMKLSVEMLESCLQAFTSGTKDDVCGMEKVYKTHFKHKFTSVIQVKDSVEGKTEKECALVWDDEQKAFVRRELTEDEQLTLDTYENAQRAFENRTRPYTYTETNGVVENIDFNKGK